MIARLAVLLSLLFLGSAAEEPLRFTGANLAGGEFASAKPGEPVPVYGKKFIYPDAKQIDYYLGKGMNVFRIPFKWENLQGELRQPLRREEVDRYKAAVTLVTKRGAVALLDPHNYARFHGQIIGEGTTAVEDYADFWRQLAGEFKDDPRVWFGLMNEPQGYKSTAAWLGAANAAIAAIRAAGARNLILVPGNFWTSAGTWTNANAAGANGEVMLGIKDPLDCFAYEVHLYLDRDNSGTHREVVSPTIGSERIERFTAWCREHHVRGFLGEFAAPTVDQGPAAIHDLLDRMAKSPDIWLGWTWWAGGPWWGDYMFSIAPKGDEDKPQMTWLVPHLRAKTPVTFTATVADGAGGGEIVPGTRQTLTATVPTGKTFDHWQGDTAWLDDAKSAKTELTMPYRNLAIQAVFTPAAP